MLQEETLSLSILFCDLDWSERNTVHAASELVVTVLLK
jgi:hypothetical protein